MRLAQFFKTVDTPIGMNFIRQYDNAMVVTCAIDYHMVDTVGSKALRVAEIGQVKLQQDSKNVR